MATGMRLPPGGEPRTRSWPAALWSYRNFWVQIAYGCMHRSEGGYLQFFYHFFQKDAPLTRKIDSKGRRSRPATEYRTFKHSNHFRVVSDNGYPRLLSYHKSVTAIILSEQKYFVSTCRLLFSRHVTVSCHARWRLRHFRGLGAAVPCAHS